MRFDIAGARVAGYSESDIVEFLSAKVGFNVDGAREAGYSDKDVLGFISKNLLEQQPVSADFANQGRIKRDKPLTDDVNMFPVGTQDYLRQDLQNKAQAPRRPRLNAVDQARGLAPDLLSALDNIPSTPAEVSVVTGNNPLRDAVSGFSEELLNRAPRRLPDEPKRDFRDFPTINQQREVMGVDGAPLSFERQHGETAYNMLYPVPGMVLQKGAESVAGALRLLSEVPVLGTPGQAGYELSRDLSGIANRFAQRYEELAAEYPLGEDAEAIRSGLVSFGQMLLPMVGGAKAARFASSAAVKAGKTVDEAAAIAAKIGSNATLLPMGGMVAGESYQKYRERGFDPGEARTPALLEGSVEVLTEKLSLGPVFKFLTAKGKQSVESFLLTMGKVGLGEQIQEQIAENTQSVIDKYMTRPGETHDQRVQNVRDYFEKRGEDGKTEFEKTVRSTAIATATMTALTGGLIPIARSIAQKEVSPSDMATLDRTEAIRTRLEQMRRKPVTVPDTGINNPDVTIDQAIQQADATARSSEWDESAINQMLAELGARETAEAVTPPLSTTPTATMYQDFAAMRTQPVTLPVGNAQTADSEMLQQEIAKASLVAPDGQYALDRESQPIPEAPPAPENTSQSLVGAQAPEAAPVLNPQQPANVPDQSGLQNQPDVSAGQGAVSQDAAVPAKQPDTYRTLDETGTVTDGVGIKPGEQFRTASGRLTTPYPKQKNEKYISQWLIDNAVAEAESRGDEFNKTSFSAEKPLKRGDLPPASVESMTMYLFGKEQPEVVPSILKPLVPVKSEPVASDKPVLAAPSAMAQKAKALGKPKASKPKLRNFFTAIKEKGGINPASLNAAGDRNEMNRPQYSRIKNKNGRGVDDVARSMAEDGWTIPKDIHGNVDTAAFVDMIKRHVNESPVVHPEDVHQQAEVEQAARIQAELEQAAELTDEELEMMGLLDQSDIEEFRSQDNMLGEKPKTDGEILAQVTKAEEQPVQPGLLDQPSPMAQKAKALGKNKSEDALFAKLDEINEAAKTTTPATSTPSATKLDDFGEKLGGARKDQAPSLRMELTDQDIISQPLSKLWPLAEIQKIEDKPVAALTTVLREQIPAKPREARKLARWRDAVKMFRGLAKHGSEMGVDSLMAQMREYHTALSGVALKIELLQQLDRAEWGRIGKVESYPDSYVMEDGNRVSRPYSMVEVDGEERVYRTVDLAEITNVVNGLLNNEAAEKRMQFEVRWNNKDGFFINKKGDRDYTALKHFDSSKDAREFIKNNYDVLVAAWEDVKDRQNVKKTDTRKAENRPRQGADHRQGKDVTPEMFQDAFGFRGVEFGNWVSQGKNAKERQGMINLAFDALHDLAAILNIPTQAISLNGSLGLAFGARGSGKFAAHYEPDTIVINLTKTRGAGSLAHEWFHALDNYFSRQRGEVKFYGDQNAYRNDSYITHEPEPLYIHVKHADTKLTAARLEELRKANPTSRFYAVSNWKIDPNHPEGVRPEVESAFAELVKTLSESPMATRASKIDKGKSDGYWSRTLEIAARSFENYVIAKMMQQGYHNDYLANVVDVSEFQRDVGRYPYHTAEELPPIAEAFDNLFATLQTKETDKGVALYRTSTDTITGLKVSEIQTIPGTHGEAVQSVKDLPAHIQEQMKKDNVTAIAGVYDPLTDRIYLVADHIESKHQAATIVISHELTHKGLAALGKEGEQLLRQIAMAHGNEVTATLNKAKAEGRTISRMDAANEFLAHEGETKLNPKLWQKVWNAIKDFFLKRVGMQASDKDVRDVLARVREALDGGATSSTRKGKLQYLLAWHGSPHDFATSKAALTSSIADAKAELNRLGLGNDTVLQFLDSIAGGKAEGAQVGDLIKIAMNAEDPVGILHHEVIHLLRQKGLISDKEWEALKLASMQWYNTHPDKAYLTERYQKYKDNNKTPEEIAEERVADMFRGWAEHQRVSSKSLVERVIDRIASFFRALANAFKGNGFVDAQGVMQAIYGGKKGQSNGFAFGRLAEVHSLDDPQHLKEYREIEARYFNEDGTEKPGAMLAPNGERSNLSKRQWIQVRTASFKKWFGDSKVVDANGEPLVVYHGTYADFTEFSDPKRLGGIFFTEDAEYASSKGDRVMPVYLSIQNMAPPGMSIERAKELGYDGAQFGRGKKSEVIVFNPEQIKSAIGNTGAFDDTNPDIRYSLAQERFASSSPEVQERRDAPPEETKYQAFKRKFQDRYNRIKTLQQWVEAKGTQLSELANVSRGLYTMNGKIADQLLRFIEGDVATLITDAANAKIDLADIEDYLLMQHAAEANAAMRKLHDDPNALAFGVTDEEAESALDEYRNRPDFTEFKRIADGLQGFTTQTADMLKRNGIITDEMRAAWEGAYQHYVPVRGGEEDNTPRTGKGMRVNARQQRRGGHERRDEHVIENIVKMREAAIRTIEKNKVSLSIARFVLEANDEQIGTIGRPEKRKVFKDSTLYGVMFQGNFVGAFESKQAAKEAIMKYVKQPHLFGWNQGKVKTSDFTIEPTRDTTLSWMVSPQLGDNEINAYMNGHQVRIQINDEIAARALTNMGDEALGTLLTVGREINTYLSKVYTQLDPRFTIRNTVRDFTAGMVNMTGDYGATTAAKIAANYPAAVKELAKARKDPAASQWVDLYRKNGGSTGASYLGSLERIGGDVVTMYHEQLGTAEIYRQTYAAEKEAGASDMKARTKALFKSSVPVLKKASGLNLYLKLVEGMNATSENAFRLATFMTLVQEGKGRSEAGEAAKNSTINFDKRGELGAQMSALWLFFNPAVQGIERGVFALTQSKHKYQAQALVGSMALAGFLAAEAARSLWGDDDEWERVSRATKNRNFVVRTGDDSFMTIPLPYEFGSFVGLGYAMSDIYRGKFSKRTGIDLAASILDGFSPLGNPINDKGEISMFGMMPTLVQMAGAPTMNQNTFGSPIAPVKYQDSKPDSQNMWRTTKGTVYEKAAAKLNEISGGNKYRAGMVDVSPEVLKFYTRSILGGAFTFVDQVANAGMVVASGGELEPHEKPFLNIVATKTGVRNTRARYHEVLKDANAALEEFRAAKRSKDMPHAQEVQTQNSALIQLARIAERQKDAIKAKRDAVDAIRLDETLTLADKRMRMKEIERQEEKLYNKVIERFLQIEQKH